MVNVFPKLTEECMLQSTREQSWTKQTDTNSELSLRSYRAVIEILKDSVPTCIIQVRYFCNCIQSVWVFLPLKNSLWDIEHAFLGSTDIPFLPCNSKMIKIRFCLHFYHLPSSFSKSLIMRKPTSTTSPVCGITFGNDVIYACIRVKILNTVTDFCLTCSHAEGKVCLIWKRFFSLEADLRSHLSFFPLCLSLRRERAQSIANQKEK